jgi:large subunit ribosomal protein L31
VRRFRKEKPLSKHPNTQLVEVRCTSCGASFTSRSTSEHPIVVDVCSNCHPAYTGFARPAATGSRIERFNRRRELGGGRSR